MIHQRAERSATDLFEFRKAVLVTENPIRHHSRRPRVLHQSRSSKLVDTHTTTLQIFIQRMKSQLE